jgi:Family of unknown function (DUF5947)
VSKLRELARREAPVATAPEEVCDLCGAPLEAEHRHLIDVSTREISCSCRACALLFDRSGAGHFRLIGDRRLRLAGFDVSDATWDELRIPVEMAFFFVDSMAERVRAFYPSPMGPTESLLELEAWQHVVAANPVLETMEPDVEALLVDRALGARRQWLVPIDACYALVGLIRTRWKGLTGGRDVWQQIGRYFDDLDRRSRPVEGR